MLETDTFRIFDDCVFFCAAEKHLFGAGDLKYGTGNVSMHAIDPVTNVARNDDIALLPSAKQSKKDSKSK